MNRLKFPGLALFAIILISACSSTPNRPWSDAIPQKVPFVIIPAENATVNSVLQSSYTPFLDDVTSSANQLLSHIDSTSTQSIGLKGIMLYTGTNDQLETVWMTQAHSGFLKKLQEQYYQRFAQNEYFFHDVVIHKLNLQDRILFAAQLQDNLLLSESSLGVEDAIRAYIGESPRVDLSNISLEPGHIIMNTPSLDQWLRQLTNVTNRPMVKNSLVGTQPTLLSVEEQTSNDNRTVHLSGDITLTQNSTSDLVATFSSKNAPITLDRYISSNAAAFGLFRLAPILAPPTSVPDTTRLDSTFMDDKQKYTTIAKMLDPEFALVTYAESGFLTTGEHLYIRKVTDPSTFRQQLSELANDNYIQERDGSYLVKSSAMAKMIGGPLCTFRNFYLDVTGEGVVISKRKGLAEMVASDRNRRRTMYYEKEFRNIKQQLSDEISGLFVTGSDFYSFLEPFLVPENYINAITAKFNMLSASARLNENSESLSFNFSAYQTEGRDAPYEEKWVFPTGADLSGEPVLADVGGSSQKEIIFATKSGHLYALASDGTVMMQANTGSDEPIGSPVVYDWYATNQNVILLAAGDKIYGWNDNGETLPKFPFQLTEQIISPLVIEDINRNGLPDAIMATADRRLHALNGRGQNIDGWPVTANAEIATKPTVGNFMGGVSILAFSENAVHAWTADGDQREGFPHFINASFNGSPKIFENNILGNAADGHLYSIGPDRLFTDSLSVYESTSESSQIEAVDVSGSGLIGTPKIKDLIVTADDQQYQGSMILTTSKNGSVFLLDTNGQLRFTQNMGQPAASSYSPLITDINSNGQEDIVALANFGRLFVWEVNSGERIYSLPTSSMEYPIVADIDGDGYQELIAQTSEGLRSWTIFGEN